ncbi:MAG: hypothetical protein AMS19_06055 [Gemmatimonas sp. SG8_23]|nr:MAG: hypothetical protein AMS19_06055 [Gemmatimonas sp. SG8_23]
MATFLGVADFEGGPILASSSVTTGAEGTYLGVVTFTNVDRTKVEALLPSAYRLAARKTSHESDVHPVMLLFGDQTDGHYLLPDPAPPVPTGIHYSELIFLVPFVQRKGLPGWHNYVVRMYLDQDEAVVAGIPYGYQKRKAWIEWRGDEARVYDPKMGPLWRGTLTWGTPWRDYADATASLPRFPDLVAIMRTRILGHHFVGLCSHWEWDFSDARIAQATTSYDMVSPFRLDMKDWPALSPFDGVADGAFVLRGVRWRLAHPPAGLC